jgi:hypothetical protein
MKKGIEYSHYCGLELLELISAIHLCMEYMKEGDQKEAENWGNYTKKMAEELRNKIAELDKINEMNY